MTTLTRPSACQTHHCALCGVICAVYGRVCTQLANYHCVVKALSTPAPYLLAAPNRHLPAYRNALPSCTCNVTCGTGPMSLH